MASFFEKYEIALIVAVVLLPLAVFGVIELIGYRRRQKAKAIATRSKNASRNR